VRENVAQLDDRLLRLLSQAFAPEEVEPPLDGLRALRQALRRNGPSLGRPPAPREADVRPLTPRPSRDLRGAPSHGRLALGTVGAILFIMVALVWSVSRGGTGSTVAATDLQLAETALHHDLSGTGPLPPSTRHDADHLAHSPQALPPADRPRAGPTPETLLAQACHRLAGPPPPYCTIASPPPSAPVAAQSTAAPAQAPTPGPSRVPTTPPPDPDRLGAPQPAGFGEGRGSAPPSHPGDGNLSSGQEAGSGSPSITSSPSSWRGPQPTTTPAASDTPPAPTGDRGLAAAGTGDPGQPSPAGASADDPTPPSGQSSPSSSRVTGR
jgi:hypothetical protein